MLITSATTTTIVTYLSLQELENYKKQFQSFWIPFMEQFIPATTVWVAGERWCNEPCAIIEPCDYDFELVEAEVTSIPIPSGKIKSKIKKKSLATIPIPIVSTTNVGSPSGRIPAKTPEISFITDLGSTTSTPIIKTLSEVNIDIQAYRNKFTSTTIERVTI